jgi:hypothetical protein
MVRHLDEEPGCDPLKALQPKIQWFIGLLKKTVKTHAFLPRTSSANGTKRL